MVARVAVQAGKVATAGIFAFSVTATGQFIYFEKTYKPLPTPRGPSGGIERALVCTGGKEIGPSLSDDDPARLVSAVVGVGSGRPRRTILFMGDSLIAGVGCRNGEAVLPRRIARWRSPRGRRRMSLAEHRHTTRQAKRSSSEISCLGQHLQNRRCSTFVG